jgi:hypothetical protein
MQKNGQNFAKVIETVTNAGVLGLSRIAKDCIFGSKNQGSQKR